MRAHNRFLRAGTSTRAAATAIYAGGQSAADRSRLNVTTATPMIAIASATILRTVMRSRRKIAAKITAKIVAV